MMRFLISSIFLIALASFPAQAQQLLDLHKKGTKKHYYFQAGDTLSLQLKNSEQILSGSWLYAGEESILLGDTVIKLKDIKWIDIREVNTGWRGWYLPANLLLYAGVGYFALDQVNTIIINDGQVDFDEDVAIISGSMVAGGILMKVLARSLRDKKARLDRRYTLHLIDYSEER